MFQFWQTEQSERFIWGNFHLPFGGVTHFNENKYESQSCDLMSDAEGSQSGCSKRLTFPPALPPTSTKPGVGPRRAVLPSTEWRSAVDSRLVF